MHPREKHIKKIKRILYGCSPHHHFSYLCPLLLLQLFVNTLIFMLSILPLALKGLSLLFFLIHFCNHPLSLFLIYTYHTLPLAIPFPVFLIPYLSLSFTLFLLSTSNNDTSKTLLMMAKKTTTMKSELPLSKKKPTVMKPTAKKRTSDEASNVEFEHPLILSNPNKNRSRNPSKHPNQLNIRLSFETCYFYFFYNFVLEQKLAAILAFTTQN